MEDLSKTQIVLLCVLVSFVVSIATGIITTALLEQAPRQITKPITRVVQRTVKPAEDKQTAQQPSGTKDVVVSEDERVSSVLRELRSQWISVIRDGVPVSIGMPYGDGRIIAPITGTGSYAAVLPDTSEDERFDVTLTASFGDLGILKDGPQKEDVAGDVEFIDPQQLSLGQKVVSLDRVEQPRALVGRVTQLGTYTMDSGERDVRVVHTDIENDLDNGALLATLDGRFIGMHMPDLGGGSFLPLHSAVSSNGRGSGRAHPTRTGTSSRATTSANN